MKLTASGVTFSAAMIRSPSFSRSSSSTTTTNLPARMSSMASSMRSNSGRGAGTVIWRQLLSRAAGSGERGVGAQQPLHVFADDVGFQVDSVAGAHPAQGGHGGGVGDDDHLETVGGDGGDGQAHPVHRDGTFRHQVTPDRFRRGDGQPDGVAFGTHGLHPAYRIHVPLDQVPAQAV